MPELATPEEVLAKFLRLRVGLPREEWKPVMCIEGFVECYDALAASQEQFQLLRDAVNDSSGECSPECGTWGHAANCEYVDMAATLVIQQRKLVASQEQGRELEAENVALRANASASVMRRLVAQGALRGPETPA